MNYNKNNYVIYACFFAPFSARFDRPSSDDHTQHPDFLPKIGLLGGHFQQLQKV